MWMMPQMLILLLLWMAMYMMKFKMKSNPKTMSPFECGYNSLFSKLPMSIQFTLLVFVFLLFDIELSILISSSWKMTNLNTGWILTISMFLMSLVISILYEMMKKSFKWK